MRSALARNAFLRDTVTSRDTITLFRFRTATRSHKSKCRRCSRKRVVDVQVSDRLVDPDDLVADDRDLVRLDGKITLEDVQAARH